MCIRIYIFCFEKKQKKHTYKQKAKETKENRKMKETKEEKDDIVWEFALCTLTYVISQQRESAC